MKLSRFLLGSILLPAILNGQDAQPATALATEAVRNPTKSSFIQTPVRLKTRLPASIKPEELYITQSSAPVNAGADATAQATSDSPAPAQLEGDTIWVLADWEPGQTHTFSLHKGATKSSLPTQTAREDGPNITLSNGTIELLLNKEGKTGPIQGIRKSGEKNWIGKASPWKEGLALESSAILQGPVFSSAHLVFKGQGEKERAEIRVRLFAGQPFAVVEETHNLSRNDSWTFTLSENYQPNTGYIRRWYSGPFQAAPAVEEIPLKPDATRVPRGLIFLQPRWTQGYDQGWFFGASDGTTLAGALVLRAGKWVWPHDNLPFVQVTPADNTAALQLPTWHGSRYWLLVLGSTDLAQKAHELATQWGFGPLDKLHNDYILDWPGAKNETFAIKDFYSNQTNPTDILRRFSRKAISEADKEVQSIPALYEAQAYMDPDWYGTYQNYWSPINPNFHTDFIKYPVARAAQLRSHPQFEQIRKKAEQLFRTDVDYAVTLPGGAGQECPGYQEHAMGSWQELASLCKKHLGFDPTQWERYKEGAAFLARISQPDGPDKRLFHPGGDTHNGKPDPVEFAKKFGANVNISQLKTQELPGFGVVFHNAPGTDQETYLAFKAGPNRGHFHGDQLSFHYCAHARATAVDHRCSYKPRAGQEHMHNRLSFSNKEFPFANMDGYERLIAFKTSEFADVAIAQVESPRLRKVQELPPENWDDRYNTLPLDKPLAYRRSIVMVRKGGDVAEDYFVLRDQFLGPNLTATYNLHVRGNKRQQNGNVHTFDHLSLLVAAPEKMAVTPFSWSHDNGGLEETQGIKLSIESAQGEFITVLYPSEKPPAWKAIPGGVEVAGDTTTFAGGNLAAGAEDTRITVSRKGTTILELDGTKEIDLNRSQGSIGLFVPDVGYPFGPIPDWLIEQRAGFQSKETP